MNEFAQPNPEVRAAEDAEARARAKDHTYDLDDDDIFDAHNAITALNEARILAAEVESVIIERAVQEQAEHAHFFDCLCALQETFEAIRDSERPPLLQFLRESLEGFAEDFAADEEFSSEYAEAAYKDEVALCWAVRYAEMYDAVKWPAYETLCTEIFITAWITAQAKTGAPS